MTTQASPRHLRDATPAPSEKALRAPGRIGVAWMLGTFSAWLIVGDTSDLGIAPLLAGLFVAGATGAWAFGYRQGIKTFPWNAERARWGDHATLEDRQMPSVRRWVWGSAIYFVLYSYCLLVAYGATPGEFLAVIQSPGEAYKAKFDAAEDLTGQTGNTLLQVLILLSVAQLALGPLVGYFWGRLSRLARLAATIGFASYVAFFLFIGTLQGIGFLLVGLLSGIMARRHSTAITAERRRRMGRRGRVVMIAAVAVFVVYMANAQAQRLDTFDVSATSRFQPNPVVESITGRDFARGLAVVAHYPTHGYRGLSYNIETPFTWAGFRGSSRAVDSYYEQFVGGSAFERTYPAQTEERTGWPANIHWATVYPWLASDFTWPGTLLLMFLLGRWTARMWIRSITFSDPIALMLFSQLALFVAFVPANNQVLISRPALIAVVCCLGLYFARLVTGTGYSSAEKSRYPSPVSR